MHRGALVDPKPGLSQDPPCSLEDAGQAASLPSEHGTAVGPQSTCHLRHPSRGGVRQGGPRPVWSRRSGHAGGPQSGLEAARIHPGCDLVTGDSGISAELRGHSWGERGSREEAWRGGALRRSCRAALTPAPRRSALWRCPEPCAAACGWRQSRWRAGDTAGGRAGEGPGQLGGGYTQHPPTALSVFWVQVLLAGLVVPLVLSATLTYTYRRCQPCKPVVPGKCVRICMHTCIPTCVHARTRTHICIHTAHHAYAHMHTLLGTWGQDG